MKKNYLILLITALLTLWMCVTSCIHDYCQVAVHSTKHCAKNDAILHRKSVVFYKSGDTIEGSVLFRAQYKNDLYIVDTIVCSY